MTAVIDAPEEVNMLYKGILRNERYQKASEGKNERKEERGERREREREEAKKEEKREKSGACSIYFYFLFIFF